MPEFRTIKIKQDTTYSISVDSIKINNEDSLQVVIPEKAVKSIHDDNSINEEEKKEKIQKTLEDLNDRVLIPELKSLFSIIQEQTQSNAGTTR